MLDALLVGFSHKFIRGRDTIPELARKLLSTARLNQRRLPATHLLLKLVLLRHELSHLNQ